MSNDSDTAPTFYTMRLDFDVDQISTALRFNLLRNTGSDPGIQPNAPGAMQTSGYAAGAYNLFTNDGINILLCASCERDVEPEIDINGLTLVAIPAPYGTTVSSNTSNSLPASNAFSPDEPPTPPTPAPLCPYDADFATCHFDDWTRYPVSQNSKERGAESSTDVDDPDPAAWRRYTTSLSFGGASSSTGEVLDTSPEPTSNLTIIASSGLWQIMGFLSVTITTAGVAKHRVYTFDPDLMVGGVTP
ncbi:hypothetical protein [Nitrospirillum iridis]|uniref:Uncharacterized protein n=1 Tax=Nitrospirillum iridis TaxID=765888 RepID=A0A7X0AVZ3_9PROT|nr:hypothetical protein [Nitrospirillum iridis]MBB6251075.1 hypothetical protein [Nitrospirillum iridis]